MRTTRRTTPRGMCLHRCRELPVEASSLVAHGHVRGQNTHKKNDHLSYARIFQQPIHRPSHASLSGGMGAASQVVSFVAVTAPPHFISTNAGFHFP